MKGKRMPDLTLRERIARSYANGGLRATSDPEEAADVAINALHNFLAERSTVETAAKAYYEISGNPWDERHRSDEEGDSTDDGWFRAFDTVFDAVFGESSP